jgi:Amidohydrolase family
MWTENVTWFSNEEGKKGRIEVGQLADLMVPNRDYFSCPEDEIADITADLTVVGGKIVYGAGEFAHLDEATPPPAMPDWSPARRFGGYAAWGDRERRTVIEAAMRQTASLYGRVHAGDVHDFTALWGALGCACWAV